MIFFQIFPMTFFFVMGLYVLIFPQRAMDLFAINLKNSNSRNEVRAVYGGSGIAMAAAIGLAMRFPSIQSGILMCLAVIVGGMAVTRFISALIDQAGFWPWAFVVIEASLILCLVLSLENSWS